MRSIYASVGPLRARFPLCLRLGLLGLLALLAGGCGSNQVEGSEVEGVRVLPANAPRPAGAPPIVRGTTLDAATGKPLAGVLVTGPGGVTARSDEGGRFELSKLQAGTSGDLVATTEDGLEGSVRLRPLTGRLLEVVIHLRRPPR